MEKKKLTREDVIKIVEEARKKGERPNLREANLSGAVLSDIDLSMTDLSWADLSHADLTDVDLFDADLTNARLNSAKLRNANLSGADLRGADLRGGVVLNGADLRYANLSYVNLGDANLIEANLSRANLSYAYLSCANLCDANLAAANLSRVNLSSAIVGHTIFSDVDFDTVEGLDTVIHLGPSEISISTLYKSKGKIPDVFLRGCGMPDNFIEYVHSLTGQAFDYFSCFISHSTKDKEFVEQLYANLQDNEVRCWYSEHDMQGGKKVHEQIDHAIRVHEKLLLILSENSMESDWVKTEIRKAKKREEKEGKRVLFPISLVPFSRIQEWEFFDSDRGRDLATEIREFYIPCFAGWEQNHDAYKKEFDKLLRDLKASEQSDG